MTAHALQLEAPLFGGGSDAALSVSQLSQHLRALVGQDVIATDVWVRGELSNVTPAASGHLYFSLKDAGGCLECVMWRSVAQWLRFELEPGAGLLVHGRVDLYPARSRYQLIVDQIEPDGYGALFLEFEQLRARLQEEGLFELERKRPLPFFPRRVAVVTSPSGAAVQDICTVIRRRCPAMAVLIVPTLVQGDTAPDSLCQALEIANVLPDVELVIVARGGGSVDDLWCFNDERVVRAIVASRLPVVSAVGHETDFTLADFAADFRAPTPSAAAEQIAPDLAELTLRLASARERLEFAMWRRVAVERERLRALSERPCLTRPLDIVEMQRQRLDDLTERLNRASQEQVREARHRLAFLCGRLDALSPLRVMGRGYAAVEKLPERRVIRAAHEVATGDPLAIRFHDGTIVTRVERIEPNEEETH